MNQPKCPRAHVFRQAGPASAGSEPHRHPEGVVEVALEEGLKETIDDISPIEDYTGNLAVQFGEFVSTSPRAHRRVPREGPDLLAPLTMVALHQPGDRRDPRADGLHGRLPMMTERGTFIINGTERVVVTQLVRSPGAYMMEPKADREKQVFIANLMPARGSWLELEIDKKGERLRPHRPQAQVPGDGAAARDGLRLRRGDPRSCSTTRVYIRNTLERDRRPREEGALIELFKKQRPGEPPTIDSAHHHAARPVLRPQALRPHARGPVQAQLAPARPHRPRHRRPATYASSRPWTSSSWSADSSPCAQARRARRRQGLRRRGHEPDRHAARAHRRPARRVRALRQPPPAHRRRARPGQLPHRSHRMERVVASA